MNVISWEDFVNGAIKDKGDFSISIGVFDGVHIGHRKLLSNILNRKNSLSGIITFVENPKKLMSSANYPGDISTLSQKLSIFSSMNIDTVILIDFSANFSNISGEDFIRTIYRNCDLSYLILGSNFRCGKRGLTTSYKIKELLKNENIIVDICEISELDGKMISSTFIRNLISAGNMDIAETMLQRVYSLDIADIPQLSGEEAIIIDTEHIHQVLPPQGHYSVLTVSSQYTKNTKILLDESTITVPFGSTDKLTTIKFIET